MTPEGEKELIALMRRIADHIAPEQQSNRKPAVLGTATYTREERDKKELRETLSGKK